MASLTLPQKRYLVQRLAVFDSPSEAAEALYEEFGVRIERDQANNYDGSKEWARGRMAADLVGLFDETRTRFTAEVEAIPIARKAYRLRRLDENERRARRMGNLPLSNDTLKQAAHEMGSMYERGEDRSVSMGDVDRLFGAIGGKDTYAANTDA